MIVFPNAKINLGLKIRRKRDDGFHDIETLFIPVALKDILEIAPSKNNVVELKTTGLPVSCMQEENLVFRAAALMQKKYHLPGINMHLHKMIPMGAGLGGGSADASFAILLINRIFNLGLSTESLINIAAEMGSDCPFFILNKPCLGTGKGEILHPLDVPVIKDLSVVIVKPDIFISTKAAYAGVTPDAESEPITDVLNQRLDLWKSRMINDFEASLSNTYPQIEEIKLKLYALGAEYASLSGSGAALYGLFRDIPDNLKDAFSDCFVWQGEFI